MKNLAVRRTPLEARWKFRELNPRPTSVAGQLPWLPAQIPGHVHLDLMREGVIQDPFFRMNERGAAWVDETDWVYEGVFHVETAVDANTFLYFGGLDTVAEISLNGEPLGSSDNMFIPHEFPVGNKLRIGSGEAGDNTFRVVFRSAIHVGVERQTTWAVEGNDTLKPSAFLWGPRSFVRKAQYMYGWDWGPELVSCGLWKPVELVEIPTARILDWKYDVRFPSAIQAVVRVEVFVERSPGSEDAPLQVNGSFPGLPTLSPALEEKIRELRRVDTVIDAISGTDESEGSVYGGNDTTVSHAPVAPSTADLSSGGGRQSVTLEFTIDQPRLWWPNGHTGPADEAVAERWFEHFAPHLYTVDLSVMSAGESVDQRRVRIGLKTVELVREPDADGDGESFGFRVNGLKLFAKGANWIPADNFPSRLTHDLEPEPGIPQAEVIRSRGLDRRVLQTLEMAADAGFNMLRVWGGGFYESEHFYNTCDELGLLVWQDFPYGCAYYPDTGSYAEAARVEATAAARRLRSHTCLALWCGNNENHTMHQGGWAGENKPARYLGEKLYHEVLPSVVEAEDPGRAYWPSSPYGGEDPNSPDYGDRHDWDVWHGVGDWTNYLTDNSRFASEFGFASSCGMAAWDKCLSEDDRWPHSPAVRWHDKTRKGYETYLDLIGIHYPAPQTLEGLVYYSQLNQAAAMKCAVEHWRRLKGRCWGVLFWQINDCWPVQSWSVIDSEGEPKAAYYAIREAFDPVLLSLVRTGSAVQAHLTNDLNIPLTGTLTITIRDFEGNVLGEGEATARVGANASTHLAALSLKPAIGRETETYVEARFRPDRATENRACTWTNAWADNILFLAEPKDLKLPDPGLNVRVVDGDSDFSPVTIETSSFAASLWLRVEGRESWPRRYPFERNFMDIRPGSSDEAILAHPEGVDSAGQLRGRLRVRTL